MTKSEALQAMKDGNNIHHDYYSPDEYIFMIGNTILDENEYRMGSPDDEFWKYIQHWSDGWHIKEASSIVLQD